MLLVDLLVPRTLQYFSAFQMYSDGKITDLQLYWYDDTSDQRPDLNAQWHAVNHPTHITDEKCTLFEAAVPFTTRYLRIDCRNSGAHGCLSYIELHGLKGYAARPENAARFLKATQSSGCKLA